MLQDLLNMARKRQLGLYDDENDYGNDYSAPPVSPTPDPQSVAPTSPDFSAAAIAKEVGQPYEKFDYKPTQRPGGLAGVLSYLKDAYASGGLGNVMNYRRAIDREQYNRQRKEYEDRLGAEENRRARLIAAGGLFRQEQANAQNAKHQGAMEDIASQRAQFDMGAQGQRMQADIDREAAADSRHKADLAQRLAIFQAGQEGANARAKMKADTQKSIHDKAALTAKDGLTYLRNLQSQAAKVDAQIEKYKTAVDKKGKLLHPPVNGKHEGINDLWNQKKKLERQIGDWSVWVAKGGRGDVPVDETDEEANPLGLNF